MSPWERLYRLADEQHQVVAVRQAAGCGVHPRTLNRRAATEQWLRPHRGVVVLPGAPTTYARTATAAWLAVLYGTDARGNDGRDLVVVGGRSAANLHGLTDTRAVPVVLLRPAGCAPTTHAGIVVQRTATLAPEDRDRVGRVVVTSIPRTIRDMAAAGAGVPELAEIAATAVQRRRLTVPQLELAAGTLGPRPGTGTLEAVVDQLRRDGPTDSIFEREIREFVCAHGLVPHPGVYPLAVHGVVIARLDVAYPPQQVFVESDGFGFHALPSQLRADHVRMNEITARSEWKGIRVGKAEFRRSPERFLRQLRAALESRGWQP